VRDLLAGEGVPLDEELRHGVLVILSELVTNAVLHAAVLSPEITVEVAVGADRIAVAVEDSHPYRPKALETDHARTGGRGLLLVGTIAAEAGGNCVVARTPGGGKVIRAVLPLGPRPLP
jgi:two-component sensor histidine kinase